MGRPVSTNRSKVCEVCNEWYISPMYGVALSKSKYCSLQCSGKRRRKRTSKICPWCFKAFEANRERTTYCSERCFSGWRTTQTGELSHSWRGGKTPALRLLRESTKYRAWRTAVYQRDNYTCQFCGVRGVAINADHILPFAYYPESRFDLSNGRTLCVPCHRTTPTYGRQKLKKET